MEVILDTNFIVSCLKYKLDFLDAGNFGKMLIPKLVLNELEELTSKGKVASREDAELGLQIISKNLGIIEIIKLNRKFVDDGIVDYVKDKKKMIVATSDKELKRKLKGKADILTIRGKKKLILA